MLTHFFDRNLIAFNKVTMSNYNLTNINDPVLQETRKGSKGNILNPSVMNKMKVRISSMVRILRGLIIISLLIPPCFASAVEYPYKKADDFETLESFKSVEKFEASYKHYIQQCLDNTYGGTGGIPCFVGYDLWDRELNIYYKRLMKVLGEKEKKLLKESQIAWIKEREKTINFNSAILDKKYPTTGTMYMLMRADDADEMITPIVKQRALLLKNWFEFIGNDKSKR